MKTLYFNNRLIVISNQQFTDVYLLINHFDEVIKVSFAPIAGDFRVVKNHHYKELIEKYFAGDQSALDKIKIKLSGSKFRQKVWLVMRQIKFGQTMSYGEIASKAGFAGAARAVGTACKQNPLPLIIPCHRVVKSDGSLGNYAYGQKLKQKLLSHER